MEMQTQATEADWFKVNDVNDIKGTKLEMFWLDIETTGLDPSNDSILEIGIIGTDRHGFPVEYGVIQEVLSFDGPQWRSTIGVSAWDKVDPFVLEMHNKSGLREICSKLEQPDASLPWAIERIIQGIKDMKDVYGITEKLPLSGSSVHFDRAFLQAKAPKLLELFSYRNIDVSTLKESAKLLNPDIVKAQASSEWKPQGLHRAIPDIIDSIEEYRYYIAEYLWTEENSSAWRDAAPKMSAEVTEG